MFRLTIFKFPLVCDEIYKQEKSLFEKQIEAYDNVGRAYSNGNGSNFGFIWNSWLSQLIAISKIYISLVFELNIKNEGPYKENRYYFASGCYYAAAQMGFEPFDYNKLNLKEVPIYD